MLELYDWQKPSCQRLVDILTDGKIALNASDTGTGKTFVAIKAAAALGRKLLVICPKSVFTSWHRAAVDLGHPDILLGTVNPERLQYTNEWYYDHKWHLPGAAMIVWDEVHRGASGYRATTTRILGELKAYPIPVLAMSATIADSPLKLRGLGYLLGLHDYNNTSFFDWCRKHGCFKPPYRNGLEFTKSTQSAREHMQRIHQAIAERLVRVRIADVPSFPEGIVLANLYDLEAKYKDQMNAIYDKMDAKLKEEGGDNALTIMLRARQSAELLKVPLLVDLVTDASERAHSVVAFINFHETRLSLMEELAPLGVAEIHGNQSADERQLAIDRFQRNEVPIIVVMSQAGGVGISLHDVRQERVRESFITPSYNAQEMVQCLGRIHRAGGTPVTQTFVLTAGTIEERIHKALKHKLSCIQTLNDNDLI